MMSTYELTLMRLLAQRIAGAPAGSAYEAVRHLTAVQAQDHPGALTSVALRTTARSRAGVEAAMTAGEVVRSWPMRGTLHLVAAEDLPWMLTLTAARVIRSQARRRAELELTDADLERARSVAQSVLGGGRELSRAGLLAAWTEAGLSTAAQRGYHLIMHLAQAGLLCFGPARDGELRLVLVAEWVRAPRRLDRDEALGELALRYFRGHGPASVADFGRWAKLVVADVRAGVALARPDLAAVTVEGVEYLLDPAVADLPARSRRSARGVFLLPGFDEYLLGYGDRSAVLEPRFANRIVPGGNGMFLPTIVADGQVVGTWRRAGRGAVRELEFTAFEPLSATVAAAVPRVYAALP